MTAAHGWRRLLRIWRRDPATDIDAELRFHLDARIADLVARGMSPDAARHQAIAEFGDVDAVRAKLSEIDTRLLQKRRRADGWERAAQDVQYLVRGLRRSPGFTAAVALTLALGIGANGAVFTLLDRIFFRPPAGVTAPGSVRRLHHVYMDQRQHTVETRPVFSYPEVRALRAAVPESIAIAAYTNAKVSVGDGPAARRGNVVYALGDYFRALGVRPAAGRFFTPDESRIETSIPVAVISYRLWMDQFGGDARALTQSIELAGHRYSIIGVAPPPFRGIDLDAADAWAPRGTLGTWKGRKPDWYESPYAFNLRVIARAPSGPSVAAVEGAGTRIVRQSPIKSMADSAGKALLVPVTEDVLPSIGGTEGIIVGRLAGVAAIILLIACANVANLLLARGMRRQREIAIRLALGVSRRRLVTQLVAESVMIAVLGGAVALVAGIWTTATLTHAMLPTVEWAEPLVHPRLALFTAVTALLAGVGAGLIPALHLTRTDLAGALKSGTREGGGHRSRLRSSLLVAQAALSIVLLAGAALFVRSLSVVESIDIGYDAGRVVFATVDFDREQDDRSAQISAALPNAALRIAGMNGVERVGLAAGVPLNEIRFVSMFLPGRDSLPKLEETNSGPGMSAGGSPIASFVSPDYFAAAGMRVLTGRGFSDTDQSGAAPVLLVDTTLARTFWPGQRAVGQCIILNKRDEPCREVVGVVSSAHYARVVEGASMHVYIPLSQAAPAVVPRVIVVRAAAGRVPAVAAQLRSILVESLGPWARPTIQPMSDMLAPQLRPWRLGAALFSAAGLLALLVAAVGVYSTMSYAMSQRAHEMGVRVALGARPGNILTLVLREGVRVVAIGVGLGVVASLALGKLVASLLYGVTPRDPMILAGVSLVLIMVAVVACLVPAWRATRVDPVEALRAE